MVEPKPKSDLEGNYEVCQSVIIHKEILDKIKSNMPEDSKLMKLAEFFKIFGDSTRIKIIYALSQVDEMCVCDLSVALGKTHSAISHQLRILRQAGIVKYRREGKEVFYSLKDQHIKEILQTGFFHLFEE